ncbi:unnamed protein product [Effrenium voratum]|nr:unnamed protein product [Effrenium voratum]
MANASEVVVVTYMNEIKRDYAYLQVSAEQHGLLPSIVGLGEVAWWPEGLGRKINALRGFLASARLTSEDLVLFADAFDTLILGDAAKIRAGFERLERSSGKSIFFPAERTCYPPVADICDHYPRSPTTLRYLNSGLLIGRVGQLRQVLVPDPVSNVMDGGDQAYYQRRFLSHQEAIGLDVDCSLLCVVDGSLGDARLQLVNGTVRELQEAESEPKEPLALHFPGPGHWPNWINGLPSTFLEDTFEQVYPAQHKLLFDQLEWSWRYRGGFFQTRILEGWSRDLMILVSRNQACWDCVWGKTHETQCRDLAWGSRHCRTTGYPTLLLCFCLCYLAFCCTRLRCKLPVAPVARFSEAEKQV